MCEREMGSVHGEEEEKSGSRWRSHLLRECGAFGRNGHRFAWRERRFFR